MYNLTGKQLVEKGIVTGVINAENIQQHGVDLNLISVAKIDGTGEEGIIYAGEKKTVLAQRIIQSTQVDENGRFWYLEPGVYDVLMSQGCNIPADKVAHIVHRSSLFRNGGSLVSALFDAGFKTEKIGTVMTITTPIKIYANARIAQLYTRNSNEVENLYNGQWQGDQQRNDGREKSSLVVEDGKIVDTNESADPGRAKENCGRY